MAHVQPIQENDAINIYTDGSFAKSYRRKTGFAGWGFLVFGNDTEFLEEYAVEIRSGPVITNQNEKRYLGAEK